MVGKDAERLMELYPRIFLACHVRHVRDPETQRLITGNQAEILDHLDEDEALSLNELAAHMGVSAPTMSVAVDKLVGLGYVQRLQSVADRRRVLLTLTPQGKKITQEHGVLDRERVAAMLESLSPDERSTALAGLERLAQAADLLRKEQGTSWSYLHEKEEEV